MSLHERDLAANEAELVICRRDFACVNMHHTICHRQLCHRGYNFQTGTTPLGDRETAPIEHLVSLADDLKYARRGHLYSLHNLGRINKDIRWDIMKLEETITGYKAMIEEAEKERKKNEEGKITELPPSRAVLTMNDSRCHCCCRRERHCFYGLKIRLRAAAMIPGIIARGESRHNIRRYRLDGVLSRYWIDNRLIPCGILYY